jgi:hypothetical protein
VIFGHDRVIELETAEALVMCFIQNLEKWPPSIGHPFFKGPIDE